MYVSIVILSVVCVSTTLCEEVKTGPQFECEHQVLSRIVQLEQDHKVMKYLLTNYQQLEDTNRETARILESQETSLRQLETGYQTILKDNEETTKLLTDQGTSLRQLETGYQTLSTEKEEKTKVLKDHDEEIKQLKGNFRVSSADVANLKTQIQAIKETVPKSVPGATYTRWGRPECPGNDSEIVYSGYVAGSFYSHKGAASNHLCLPNEPQWDTFQNGWAGGGYIYGAEYHMPNSEIFLGKTLQYHVPPCAVCRTSSSNVVMIPARTTCYDGWTKEFGGYLVSGKHDHNAATEFICLDKNASIAEWSKQGAQYGRLLYTVEGDCNYNLKCPPYESYKEFTCIVCSK